MPSATTILHVRFVLTAIAFVLWQPVAALGQPPRTSEVPTAPPEPVTTQAASRPAKPDIYDTAADAKAQIAAAVDKAKRENQRVLLMFGGNWCGWCHKLHELFSADKDIAKTLLYEYQLVMVDIGRRDKNLDVAERYEANIKEKGVPFLSVLDADSKVLIAQETGSLEAGDHHDPEKVAAFLDKWKAQPRDAEKLLADALSRAKKEDKTVLLHLGAPWCPWCHRLDDFLARKDIAETIQSDIIDLKIDVDRMTNGKDVATRLRKTEESGIPWMILLDGEGKPLITSDGPKGNIGYPAEAEEISYFTAMLKKSAKRLSADQISQVEKALKDAAAKLKPPAH